MAREKLEPKTFKLNSSSCEALKLLSDNGVDVNSIVRRAVDLALLEELERKGNMGLEDALNLRQTIAHNNNIKANTPVTGRAKNRIDRMIESGDFSEATHSDWHKYFALKSKEHGLAFSQKVDVKNGAVLKSAINNYEASAIKMMIDFIYDSGQKQFTLDSNPIMCLSASWKDYTYNNAVKWKSGKFNPESKPKQLPPKRESSSKRETISKSKKIGEGISL